MVHFDIFGLVYPISNGGKRYLITLLMIIVKNPFCKRNQKLLVHLKSSRNELKNQIRRVIKTLRTDHGGEYCSKEFQVLYDKNGIRKELIIA